MSESQTPLSVEKDPLTRRELYKFSPEELRVLKECNYESFYFRSLPMGTALGTLAYYGVKSGYLKGSTKWGPWPKILLGASFGYFAGKLSYQTKCAEKLMTLPNSPLAEALRQRRGRNKGGFQEVFTSEPINLGPSTLSSDADSGNPSDYLQELRSEDRSYDAPPTAIGLNDSFRPSMDSFVVSEQPLPSPTQHSSSYDELRRQNREEFEQKRLDAYKKTDGFKTNPNVAPHTAPGYGTSGVSSRAHASDKKNSYGDVWEE
ncbi:OCIA domain-containing protein 1 [Daphnia magna]|uniref:OCIA domain-containing protein 1 n=1 Tax=Daphnia magna TaxID=35525 RepID=UPI001E1BCA73|nr:OCIA domain-containing protein 1 [Daphnia magna]